MSVKQIQFISFLGVVLGLWLSIKADDFTTWYISLIITTPSAMAFVLTYAFAEVTKKEGL
jgi:hypothetical protein